MRRSERTWISTGLAIGLAACGDNSPGGNTGDASEGTTAVAGTTEGPTPDPTTTTGVPEPTTTPVDPTTGDPTTEDPTTGPPPGCAGPQDCPAAPACKQATCEAGACGFANLAEGTLVEDIPGDCRRTVCDGAGGTKMAPADDDTPAQTPGDCRVVACAGGQVQPMPADDDLPDDGNDCTVDACDAGEPAFTPKPANTLCGPESNQFCHDDATCQLCKQVFDDCEELGPEPHETQATAYNFGKISDADASGSSACGTLKGDSDVDWYMFTGEDVFLNFVDPTRVLTAQGGARLCVYVQCEQGETSLGCGNDMPDTAPLGQKGCCGAGSVAPTLNCAGTDDSAKVWIRVDNPEQVACIPYQLDYHF